MMFGFLTPKRIANKIIFLVLVLELAFVGIWGTLTYTATKKEIFNTINAQLNESSRHATAEIKNSLLNLEASVNALSDIMDLANLTATNKNTMLARLMKKNPELDEISLIDNTDMETVRLARMRAITHDDLRDFDKSKLIRYARTNERANSNITFSDYFEPQIEIAFLIKDLDKVILSKVNLKWLWDKVLNLTVGGSGYTYVVDNRLTLVAHPDNSYVLSNIDFKNTDVPREMFLVRNMSNMTTYKNIAGELVAGVSRFDATLNWWVFVELPVEVGFAPLDRLIERFIFTFLLIAFISVFIVIHFTRKTMKPLEALGSNIARLTDGERNVRMTVTDNSDLETLLNGFNAMAASLDDSFNELEYRAFHDSLTQLPNRVLLHKELDNTFSLPSPANNFSLLLIDLDRFKEINDSIGHKAGDDLLIQLGLRLKKLLSSHDLIARLGGDEFAIILRSQKGTNNTIKLTKHILDAIRQPFELDEIEVQVDASIGIAFSPLHASDGSRLLRFADIAMYQAKTKSIGYEIYDSSKDSHSPRRLALMAELLTAIDNNELVLHYQPKINIKNKLVIGFEALVRWNHPEHGLLYPDEFVPLAELGRMIKPLTYWVIDQALSDCRAWKNKNCDADIAVNISVRNLLHKDLIRVISESLSANNIEPHCLQLEITESAIMTDPARAKEALDALFDLGVKLVIDDFGTGYSSLAYLKELPVDALKIDKSFVMNMTDNENDVVIIRSTIDMSHNLGLSVIAEGVESEAIMELLKSLRCDYAQGYHISRPIPANEVVKWYDSRASKLDS